MTSTESVRPPITRLHGVGEALAKKLAGLGLGDLPDVLEHYPFRWIDRGSLRDLATLCEADARATEIGEDGRPRKATVTVLGKVVSSSVQGPPGRFGRSKQRLVVQVRDETGSADVVFFGGGWRKTQFAVGMHVLATGPVNVFRGRAQVVSPEYEVLADEEEAGIHTGHQIAVYPSTKGITQNQWRTWIQQGLDWYDAMGEDPVPETLLGELGLVDRRDALYGIHKPTGIEHRERARKRLAFDELFLDQLFVGAIRARREHGVAGRVFPGDGPLVRRVRAGLPFTLTGDQNRALADILGDLASGRPMNRLLQGDVGSGKTVVALLTAAAAADAGVQTAFLAPTEILAEQHFRTLRDMGTTFGLEPRLLTGSTKGPARKEILRSVKDGSCPLLVGTHAIFQDGVDFFDLGLVVVDEQHRFGVLQRVALWEKGNAPHVLAMSATPIPRSLALVRYADLDLSIIRERPKGRGKVITRVSTESKRDAMYGFLAERLAEGRQAYVIYPLVEESAKSDLKAATTMAKTLAERPEFADYTVELLHGQMKSEDKDAAMRRFQAGEVQILVATTVIEVGIDVANASFMVIEHPERYGLSQLHQLRGRVGRGEHTSYCVLLRSEGDEGVGERLRRFASTDDGFEVARMDLEYRGQGDVAGTRQSGRPAYKLADPYLDEDLLLTARETAQTILEAGRLEEGGAWSPLRRRLDAMLEGIGALVEAG